MILMQESAEELAENMENGAKTLAQKAYENLQKFRRRGTADMDYKAELYSALEEKYGNVD